MPFGTLRRSVWFSHLLNYSFEACELHNILLMVFDYSQGAIRIRFSRTA